MGRPIDRVNDLGMLAVALWWTAELLRPPSELEGDASSVAAAARDASRGSATGGTRHPLETASRSFAFSIAAVTPRRLPRDHIGEIKAAYVSGRISIVSLEIELAHLPGGL